MHEAAQRRALREELLDLKGTVRVLCRVRPELPEEHGRGPPAVHCVPGEGEIDVFAGRYDWLLHVVFFTPRAHRIAVFLHMSGIRRERV